MMPRSLDEFFNRAFQYEVLNRFLTADELSTRLHRLRDQSDGDLVDIDPLE